MNKTPCNYYSQCKECIDCLLGFNNPFIEIYKRGYSAVFIADLVYNDNPFLKLISKEKNKQ